MSGLGVTEHPESLCRDFAPPHSTLSMRNATSTWAGLRLAQRSMQSTRTSCTPRYDASLCLGLAGLGEVVLIAGQLLDDETYQGRAQELGRAMIERHSASADWPSGVASGGPNPSFMLGLAGIGHWLLHLHDPQPSSSAAIADPGAYRTALALIKNEDDRHRRAFSLLLSQIKWVRTLVLGRGLVRAGNHAEKQAGSG